MLLPAGLKWSRRRSGSESPVGRAAATRGARSTRSFDYVRKRCGQSLFRAEPAAARATADARRSLAAGVLSISAFVHFADRVCAGHLGDQRLQAQTTRLPNRASAFDAVGRYASAEEARHPTCALLARSRAHLVVDAAQFHGSQQPA